MAVFSRSWLAGPRAALAALVLTGAALAAGSAEAQWFPRGPQPRQDFFFPFFSPSPVGPPPPGVGPNGEPPRPVVVDSSRAPPPQKPETPPRLSVVVFGDSMADWLAYGLENAFSDTPEVGILRKHRTVSGLIRYQPRGEPSDWAAAAKSILANEKPDLIVMMVGLHDRQSIRDTGRTATAAKPAQPAPGGTDAELPNDEGGEAQPAIIANERSSAPGVYEFRSEKWQELYGRKIDETVAVLKSKGVPVIWVGLPAIRGPRATADLSYLNSRYREAMEKAGVPFVDVWDGFVDESGRFAQFGPDFEGQTRRLRSGDGVHFTKAGALKLARLAERDIRRLLALRSAPSTEPVVETPAPQAARPGPAVRPMAGPVVPLRAAYADSNELAGASRAAAAPAADPLANRVLARGEAIAPPSGRADDFAWPHRDVGTPAPPLPESEMVAAPTTPIIATAPATPAGPAAAPQSAATEAPEASAPVAPPAPVKKKAKKRAPPVAQQGGEVTLFGRAAAPRRPPQPVAPQRAAAPRGFGDFWR